MPRNFSDLKSGGGGDASHLPHRSTPVVTTHAIGGSCLMKERTYSTPLKFFMWDSAPADIVDLTTRTHG